MPTFDISIRDTGTGSAVVVSSIAFTATPTVPTAEQSVFVWNDFALVGTDDFPEGRFSATARISGGAGAFAASGFVALDSLATQIRIVSSSISTVAATTPIGVGAGNTFPLPVIPSGNWVEIGISIALPATPANDVELTLAVAGLTASSVPAGIPNQIVTGVGDAAVTFVSDRGATTESTVPDDLANLAAAQWIFKGTQVAQAATTEQFNNLDGLGATLGVGESYVAALTIGATAINVTKGVATTTPVTIADLPTLPTDEELFDWIRVDGADTPPVIETIDINQFAVAELFTMTSSGGVLTVSAGRAVSDSKDVIWQTSRTTTVVNAGPSAIVFHAFIDAAGELATVALPAVPPGNPVVLYRVDAPFPLVEVTFERIEPVGL